MRVALAGHCPLDPDRISDGPQAVFAYLLEGLRQFKELDLHVVSAHKRVTEPIQFRRDNVTFYFLPHPRLPFELAYPLLRRCVSQVLHRIKPDLVHAQTAHIYGTICLGAGYPTVTTVHSLPGAVPGFGPDWITRTRLTLHERWTSRTFLPNARHIVTISEYIRQGLAPHTRATFYPIDNPVANAFFELPSDQAVPGRLLFVGALRQVKRPDLALEALVRARQEMPELRLQFAGAAIEPELEARMRDYVAKRALDGNVEFLGHLPETQLLKAYQQMSILLLTSEVETSPMAVEQAMAAGKPVVATAVGGVPFLVNDGQTGFLAEPNNPEQIARALVRLARDHELRCTMGQVARREALVRFRAEVVAAKTYAVYQRILKTVNQYE
jgi:glycosyltransferase involved in cell wall biosynthesis